MARAYRRTGTTVSLNSITTSVADTITAEGTQTVLSLLSAGNCDGATELEVFATISSPGASLTGVDLYVNTSEDDTTYTNDEYALTGAITAAGTISLGILYSPSKYTKMKVSTQADTAVVALEVVPYHIADA